MLGALEALPVLVGVVGAVRTNLDTFSNEALTLLPGHRGVFYLGFPARTPARPGRPGAGQPAQVSRYSSPDR